MLPANFVTNLEPRGQKKVTETETMGQDKKKEEKEFS